MLRTTTSNLIAVRRLLLEPDDPEVGGLGREQRCRLHRKPATMSVPWPLLSAIPLGQPQPRDRLMLPWLLSVPGSNVERAGLEDAVSRHCGRGRFNGPRPEAISRDTCGAALRRYEKHTGDILAFHTEEDLGIARPGFWSALAPRKRASDYRHRDQAATASFPMMITSDRRHQLHNVRGKRPTPRVRA